MGICRVRKAAGGCLWTLTYAKCVALAVDRVEKKPFRHFYPGKLILSLAGGGCNLRCPWCQNAHISQKVPEGRTLLPTDVLDVARRQGDDCIGVAFTYSEPLVWYEYVLDTAALLQDNGYKTALVTNGSINREPLKELLPFVDAMNIDIKGFTEEFYSMCGGRLRPVLDAAELAKKYCHVELTYLIIPGLNDNVDEIRHMTEWVADSLGRDTPVHFTRYFPSYRMRIPATPRDTLIQATKVAGEMLTHVYLGNL